MKMRGFTSDPGNLAKEKGKGVSLHKGVKDRLETTHTHTQGCDRVVDYDTKTTI